MKVFITYILRVRRLRSIFFCVYFFTTYDVPLTTPITLTIVTTDCMEEISPGWVSVVVFRQFIETGPEIPTEFRPINTDSCSNYKQWKMIVLFYNSFCWILIQFLWQLTANSINLVPAEICPLEADPNNIASTKALTMTWRQSIWTCGKRYATTHQHQSTVQAAWKSLKLQKLRIAQTVVFLMTWSKLLWRQEK